MRAGFLILAVIVSGCANSFHGTPFSAASQPETITSNSVPSATVATQSVFVRKGPAGELRLGAARFNYASVNIHDLLLQYIQHGQAAGRAKLVDAAAAGFRSVRFFASDLDGSGNTPTGLYQRNPTHFFAVVDQMINDAKNLGIGLIPSLWGLGGGNFLVTGTLSPGCTQPHGDALVPGGVNNQALLQFMRNWALRYASEPGILFWELGNELNLFVKERSSSACVTRAQLQQFINQASTLIRSVDLNHLIASGAIQELDPMPLDGPSATIPDYLGKFMGYWNNLPNIDFYSLHFYEPFSITNSAGQNVTMLTYMVYFQNLARKNGKALWIGEAKAATPWPISGVQPFIGLLTSIQRYIGLDIISAWSWEVSVDTSSSSFVANMSLTPQSHDSIVSLTDTNSGINSSITSLSQADGNLAQISVGPQGDTWGINSTGSIYHYNPITLTWRGVPGYLTSIAVGPNGDVWGLSNGSIYRYVNQNWQPIPGILTKIAVGADDDAWGLNGGAIFHYVNGSWQWVPGYLTQLVVGNAGAVWGLNGSSIFHYVGGPNVWQNVPGALLQISAGPDGDVWGINGSGSIYYYVSASNNWQYVPGWLTEVQVGANGNIWGINGSGNVYHYVGGSQVWLRVGAGLSTISVGGNGSVWGLDPNQNIFQGI